MGRRWFLSRDSTGAPSIRQSKAKKMQQEAGDRLRSAECDLPPAGSNDCPYDMWSALYQ